MTYTFGIPWHVYLGSFYHNTLLLENLDFCILSMENIILHIPYTTIYIPVKYDEGSYELNYCLLLEIKEWVYCSFDK